MAGDLPSYRDLPINLFQVEWKYRDEKRPRFGLLRGREFLMKDAYSFDRDEAGMAESYRVMYEAYERIFDRIGFEYVVVEADPGSIGGDINHEFMALADVGEDLFVRCTNGDYLADTEAATPQAPPPLEGPELEPLVEVDTPGAATIDLVAAQLGIEPERTLKNIMFDVDGRTVAVLVPGDRDVSEKKLARLHFPEVVRPFDDADFARLGYAKGYVGPHGFGDDVEVFADPSVRAGANWVTGANAPDVHVTGANLGRDFRVDRWADLVAIRDGDRCPVDGGELEIGRSIVVGHIYQLSTRYSEPLGATFQDEDGTDKPYLMGSYGIGITRILAALVEQHHDDDGIVWPAHIAPFQVVVIMANADDDAVRAEAERIHDELVAEGVETLLDDRDERAGVKFADADLVGYPVQVTVGKRGLDRRIGRSEAPGERRALRGAGRRGRAGRERPARHYPLRRRRGRRRDVAGRSRRSGLYSGCTGAVRRVFGGGLAPTFSFVGEGRAVDVEALLERVVEDEGLELYDVTRGRDGGRKVLRVFVDGPHGVDLDTLTGLTELISRRLDEAGYETGPYDLQVSSPGLERSLRRPDHFRQTIGRQVTVKTTAPVAGSRTHTGTLVAADDEGVTLEVGGDELPIELADITSARTVVDWGAELKRSNA